MTILKRAGLVLLVLVLALGVLAGGVYLWALMSTDTSLVARGIIWGGSKVDDWKRFPSRQVHASSEPLYFEAASPDTLTELTFDGKPLATYLEETNTTAFIILHGDCKPY